MYHLELVTVFSVLITLTESESWLRNPWSSILFLLLFRKLIYHVHCQSLKFYTSWNGVFKRFYNKKAWTICDINMRAGRSIKYRHFLSMMCSFGTYFISCMFCFGLSAVQIMGDMSTVICTCSYELVLKCDCHLKSSDLVHMHIASKFNTFI